jgi:aryl-alcohol dehydrogenase-like predicted oxidoreductase
MKTRKVGQFDVSSMGLGCMSMSHAYGVAPSAEQSTAVLMRALELGYTFFDTAALYGFGANEKLLGAAMKGKRSQFTLASKCGLVRNADGKREINGTPQSIRKTCDESLANLQTDVIDLYYLHRLDRKVPIEESVGALAELVKAGKIRSIGLSEVSAATLRKAHAVHPIAAVQTEYSLWTRNPEVAVLDACRQLGTALVAFSPVARGFLAGGVTSMEALPANDIRQSMPRFQGENFSRNLALLDGMIAIGDEIGATPAQLCLAWLLQRDPIVVPIPGTTRLDHLEENTAADALTLSPEMMARLDALVNPRTVAGPRYAASTLPEIDTEDIAA